MFAASLSNCFSTPKRLVIEWVQYYIYLTKPACFLFGLVFAHGLVKNAVADVLMLYLIEDWESSNLPKAAAIINIEEGVTAIIALVIAHFTDACIGRFKMVLFTTASYIIGLMLLWFSTWLFPLHVKVRVFYPALVLVALGKAGKDPPFKAFLADQLPSDNEEQVFDRTNFWWRVLNFLGAAVSVFLLNRLSWKATFMISTIVMVTAYFWFLSGFLVHLYDCKEPTTSPLATLCKVFKAAICNRNLNYPPTPTGYFMNERHEVQFSPRHRILRWMDKAAIKRSSSSDQEQKPTEELPSTNESESESELCSVAEVKDAKRLLTLIPLWTTFLMYSLVQAAGNTFFIEQSDGMDFKVGSYNVPINLFFVLKSLTGAISSYLVDLLIPKQWTTQTQQRAQILKINAGMVFSILCCIVAWQVEVHRLKLIKKCGCWDSDNENRKIPMSVLWLVPQFFLLGFIKGLAEDGLREFFYNQVDKSMKLFETPFNGLVIGIGKFLIVFFIPFRRSWFGDAINYSRLDKYFRLLAILSFCNLCFCVFVSCRYARLEGEQQPKIIQFQPQEPPIQEDAQDQERLQK
ncbi:hypothetical protein P3X46_028404 [Hevea brasiliensis]|uniref:Major facilitator superfamily (MFS) profile domain-containing protein n=2 Tax=Hevea brasiliensis TaxID=3981 RepID=A0ABQ9KPR5_HEVBR|nr:hypothetical protein P3X46_028404 [Hevea brasiliensis]